MGLINESANSFLYDLGRRISLVGGEDREPQILFLQRISVTIQRLTRFFCTTVSCRPTTRISVCSRLYFSALIFHSTPSVSEIPGALKIIIILIIIIMWVMAAWGYGVLRCWHLQPFWHQLHLHSNSSSPSFLTASRH